MEKILELSSFVNSLEFVGKSDIQEMIGKIILCEMNDQKIGKFDLYSLASNEENVKSLMGVYHKDGYKYVTNKHILCKTKQDYAPQLDGRENMNDKDILTQVIEWANSSHAYLSARTPYAKGYKDGISQAKEIILEIINSENK